MISLDSSVTLIIVATALYYVAQNIYKTIKLAPKGCSGCCSACSHCNIDIPAGQKPTKTQ